MHDRGGVFDRGVAGLRFGVDPFGLHQRGALVAPFHRRAAVEVGAVRVVDVVGRVGGFLQVAAAPAALAGAPHGEGDHPRLLLFVPFGFALDDGLDVPAVVVVDEGVDFGGFPTFEPFEGDAGSFGRLYSGSKVCRIREAAREKGTSTPRRFSDHAAPPSASTCPSDRP